MHSIFIYVSLWLKFDTVNIAVAVVAVVVDSDVVAVVVVDGYNIYVVVNVKC